MFYDDALCLGLSWRKAAGSTVQETLGTKLDRDKRANMTTKFICTGVSFDLSLWVSSGTLSLDAKEGRKEAIVGATTGAQRKTIHVPCESKITAREVDFSELGRSSAVASALSSIASTAKRPTASRRHGLRLSISLTSDSGTLPARAVRCEGSRGRLAFIWTDATHEPPAPARPGFVLVSPRLQRPLAVASALPHDVLRQLLPRKQQIGQAEAFAGILPPLHCPEALRDLDLMHFVGNTSALAVFTVVLPQLRTRVRFLPCTRSGWRSFQEEFGPRT